MFASLSELSTAFICLEHLLNLLTRLNTSVVVPNQIPAQPPPGSKKKPKKVDLEAKRETLQRGMLKDLAKFKKAVKGVNDLTDCDKALGVVNGYDKKISTQVRYSDSVIQRVDTVVCACHPVEVELCVPC
jgi:hypothetical protein